jgi:type IV pilus biogenesis protein CpaD/CtpE
VQRVESGPLSKRLRTVRRPLGSAAPVLLLAGVMAPAAGLLSGCGSGADLVSTMALPTQQTEVFVDGVGVPPSADGIAGSGHLDLTAAQHAYLDALLAAGIHPSSELRALSIGSYVCQARAAGQTEQAVWEYVAPMVRSDVPDSQAATPQSPAAVPADAAIGGYIRLASQLLC